MNQRVLLLLLTLFVLFSGLIAQAMPLSAYTGDALWAMMIFFGLSFLFPKGKLHVNAMIAFFFAVIVEYSQLYHGNTIESLRDNAFLVLILGHGTYSIIDIINYAVGILIGMIALKITTYKLFRN